VIVRTSFTELKAFMGGRGFRPASTLASVLAVYEGSFLQRRTWRNFLFVGDDSVEIVHNRGNWKRKRTLIPYTLVREIYVADFETGIPKDVVFLGSDKREVDRFIDANPSEVDEILASLRAATEGVSVGSPKIHRLAADQPRA